MWGEGCRDVSKPSPTPLSAQAPGMRVEAVQSPSSRAEQVRVHLGVLKGGRAWSGALGGHPLNLREAQV